MITVEQNLTNRTFAGSVIQGAEETVGTTTGLGRWLRRNWRKALGVAVGLIGGPVGIILGPLLVTAIEEMLNGAIYDIGIADADGNATISETEATVLESWFGNVFVPKYEILVKKANVIFTSTNVEEQVKLVNALNNELAVTKEYLNWENPKLSPLALETRNSICAELIYEIEKIIYQSIEKSPLEYIAENVGIVSTPTLLYPIYSIQQFKAVATNYTLGQLQTIDTVETLEVEDHTETLEDTIIETTTETKKAGFSWWWLVAGFVGYKVLK